MDNHLYRFRKRKMSKKVKAEPSPEELFESIMDQQRDQSFREECTDQNTVLKNVLDTLSALSIRVENGIRMISELHVKVDTIGQKVNQIESYLSSRESGSSRGPSTTPSLKRTFKKVKSLKELETLEQKCHDPEFLQESIDYLGSIHGKSRYMGEGATVCLQLYDTFFDRRFMLSCSWTGSGKKQKKIPFLRFEKVIELYFLAVSYSDPTFTLDQTKRFLHRCLRNATQRVKEVSGKKPVSRKRKLRAVKENGDGDSEEEQAGDVHDDHPPEGDDQLDDSEEQPEECIEQEPPETNIEQDQFDNDSEQEPMEEETLDGRLKIEILHEELL
ncbi:hypothetical protein pipiens_018971 [Culex pipiens pipiens]|uniref:DUF4806 domain-containing protein n=1 Tax=Culex pipiens pipiens TaxID=38569 RepID=A0ABD1DX15_CULPP